MPHRRNHKKTRIVVLGGGFAGVYFVKRLHARLHGTGRFELFLVSPENFFLFTPLLHEVATGSLYAENVVEPLRKVATCCLTDFYQAKATRIRRKDRVVETTSGEIAYDYLVLATGATTNFFNTPGAEEHAFVLKSVDNAAKLKARCIDLLEAATKTDDPLERARMLHFAVIGGGPTGVELAAEMAELFEEALRTYYARFDLAKHVRITLVQKGEEVLPQFSPSMRRKAAHELKKKGIELKLGIGVVSIEKDRIVLEDKTTLGTLTPIWVAGIRPNLPAFDEAVETDRGGRIVLTQELVAKSDEHVYAIGDVGSFLPDGESTPLPQLAQVAVAQGTAAADNVARRIAGKKPVPFRYRHMGNLVSLGQWAAIAEIGKFHAFGHVIWWVWRTVYLSKLLSWQKKFQVVVDWTIDLFLPRDISRF
jgi:NADH dehydrogenase